MSFHIHMLAYSNLICVVPIRFDAINAKMEMTNPKHMNSAESFGDAGGRVDADDSTDTKQI